MGDTRGTSSPDYEVVLHASGANAGRWPGSAKARCSPASCRCRVSSVRTPQRSPWNFLAHLVAKSCPYGGVVVGPFAGTGATLVAAVQLGRRAVGIELEERYCEAAARRLEQALREGPVRAT